ncbi:MAG TPA: zinc-binding dehydrogenase [Streptosporangiaceae bacterium]
MEITRYGGPEVLCARTAPDPSPGPGQVLIHVEYAEVLFIDTQLRAGWGQEFFPMRPPWVPGAGVSGTIRAVGDGVAAERIGARVIARTGSEGGYAELVVVASQDAVDIPGGLDGAIATAALHDGPLALDRLERAGLGVDSRVLVTAAAGSLGHWFVPLAKAAGARVTGAAGGPDKCLAVAGLGADLAVDYHRDDWTERADGPFDVVFDGAGGAIGHAAFTLTRDGGMFFAHGAAAGEFGATADERGIRVIGVDVQLDDAAWSRYTRAGLDLLAQGQVSPVVGQRIPLERAGEAHATIAARRVIGKSVLVA